MDLSKAFDCIPHNLLIANLHAYGLHFDTVTFPRSYLKHRKQSVKINYQDYNFRCTTEFNTRSNPDQHYDK